MDIEGYAVRDEMKSIYEFKGRDFKNLELDEWLYFCKANKEFREPGVSYDELKAIHEAMEIQGRKPITILETGMCFGSTTRYFVIRKMKYGGEVNSIELKIRAPFIDAMKELGLSKEHNVIEGDTMIVPWNKKIDFLFIDSEHGLSDALGEYMRYRAFVEKGGFIGFHDTDFCYGVSRTIQIANEIDDLVLVSESTKVAGAGVKIFKMRDKGVVQNRINHEKQKNKKEWQ